MTYSFERLLVATDLSNCSGAALALALYLARAHGASVDAVFVASDPAPLPNRDELSRFIESAQTADVSVRLHIEHGDVRERILATAERLACDAIVLGTHGRSGRVHALAGSVAESVVRTASCPVITVRERS